MYIHTCPLSLQCSKTAPGKWSWVTWGKDGGEEIRIAKLYYARVGGKVKADETGRGNVRMVMNENVTLQDIEARRLCRFLLEHYRARGYTTDQLTKVYAAIVNL